LDNWTLFCSNVTISNKIQVPGRGGGGWAPYFLHLCHEKMHCTEMYSLIFRNYHEEAVDMLSMMTL